ncbi:hypothetical protein ACTHGU_09805 [Chitinophagaceae bacterium MMS25-I14]
MKKLLLLLFAITGFCSSHAKVRIKKPVLSGIYLQWGYNRDWFSKSDLHFRNGDKYDFVVHKAVAHDQPDFSGFRDAPLDITIPQNSYRIGFYLNAKHTHAIEINFDHAKYVVDDPQQAHVTGHINGQVIDGDTMLIRPFLHFEHTNGANFYHINYVEQHTVWEGKKRPLATVLWKVGAGIVVPRSDVTLMGVRLDNKYHIAGYIASAELGTRFYPIRNLFIEANIKGGFANYLNVLTVDGGKAYHHFWYGEVIGLIGYDISFHRHQKNKG